MVMNTTFELNRDKQTVFSNGLVLLMSKYFPETPFDFLSIRLANGQGSVFMNYTGEGYRKKAQYQMPMHMGSDLRGLFNVPEGELDITFSR